MSAAIAERDAAETEIPDDRDCEAIVDFLGTAIPCPMPAIGRFTRTCPCDHSREGDLCELHAEMSETGYCLTCFELPGGESHECPITLVPVVQP